MSNAERQRQFRARNPGYYARLQATKRASIKRGAQRLLLEQIAAHPDAFPTTTPDVVPVTAIAEVVPVTVPTLTITTTLVLPTAEAVAPAFEVVADSPDVFLRIFQATPSDALAA